MRALSLSLFVGSLLVAGSAAHASTISVGASAFSNPPAITFEGILYGEAIANQYAASQGVTFGNLWGNTAFLRFFTDGDLVVAANFGIGVFAGAIPVTMDFSSPYKLVGFEIFSNGLTYFDVTGADGITDSFSFNAKPSNLKAIFVGFENPTGISSISIGPSAGNGSLLIDNMILQAPASVPEPGTLALVGVSLLGLAVASRRRFARQPRTVSGGAGTAPV